MKLIKIGARRLKPIAKLSIITGLALLVGIPALVAADNVVQGFSSHQTLQPGLVVALDKDSTDTVVSAPARDASRIYGVVVDPSDAPITLNANSQNSQVFVATSGIYRVLVSTSNGTLKPGDYLSMSSIDGIAAKASSGQPTVLGQAESAFDGRTGVITTSGNSAIGRIYANINVQKNPLANADPAVPRFLKRLADSLANKPVSVLRIYTALIIFLIAAAASITILWSGVKNSLVSLGRNPLSRHTIFSGMYKVIFTGLGIFILGLAGVYLLLKV
jgi:hypothetical protein